VEPWLRSNVTTRITASLPARTLSANPLRQVDLLVE